VVGRLLPAAGPGGVPLVQVSAAINPGSSGGPLFDEAGRVGGNRGRTTVSTSGGFSMPMWGGSRKERLISSEMPASVRC
jgi:S1-C subfamily serine protease